MNFENIFQPAPSPRFVSPRFVSPRFVSPRIGKRHEPRPEVCFFIWLVIGCLLSCNSSTDKVNEQKTNKNITASSEFSLSGKVFFYAPALDTTTCEAIAQCDCCSGKFLFMNETDFLMVDVCEANKCYRKGTYKMEGAHVVLHFDNLTVQQNYNWEKEVDTTGTVMTEYFVKQTKSAESTVRLTRLNFDKNLCFKMGSKGVSFVTLDRQSRATDLLKQLQDEGIWEKLELKLVP